MKTSPEVNILWFRKALRLNDNSSLRKATDSPGLLLPIYIFDGKTTVESTLNVLPKRPQQPLVYRLPGKSHRATSFQLHWPW